MNLKELRKQFVTLSGRHDLWNDDGTDAGADYFIRCGQRYVENLLQFDKTEGFVSFELTDKNVLLLPRLRSISFITLLDDDGNERELTRCGYVQARKFFAGDNALNDRPSHYFVLRHRGNVEKTLTFVDSVANMTESEVVEEGFLNAGGIVLVPAFKTATTKTVNIYGLFREVFLTDNEDKNFWSLEWPQLLLYASLRELEVSYRNTQGVKDWDAAIMALTITLEHDHVLDESTPVNQMLG